MEPLASIGAVASFFRGLIGRERERERGKVCRSGSVPRPLHSLTPHSSFIIAAEIVKETCYDVDAGPLSSEVITRLYHAKSRRYICFNKKGKIRTVVSAAASLTRRTDPVVRVPLG